MPDSMTPAEIQHESATLRLVVLGLIAVAVASIVSVTVLSYFHKPAPEAMIGMGSAAVGALATLLARVGAVNGRS